MHSSSSAPKPWMDAICAWFENKSNLLRLKKVSGYCGCRELWLQAEIAMWLEQQGLLHPTGEWDTNLRIPAYGRADLAASLGGNSYELVVEMKILGSTYQRKVLSGGAFRSLFQILRSEGWNISEQDIDKGHSFSLVHDYKRLRDISSAQTKILLLVAISDPGNETELGEALTKINFPAASPREVKSAEAEGIVARLWQL